MKTPIKPNAARCARFAGCTIEQAKKMLAKNAAGFTEMADRAKRTGRNYNGFTEAELRLSATQYLEASL